MYTCVRETRERKKSNTFFYCKYKKKNYSLYENDNNCQKYVSRILINSINIFFVRIDDDNDNALWSSLICVSRTLFSYVKFVYVLQVEFKVNFRSIPGKYETSYEENRESTLVVLVSMGKI